jgi:phenylalanyl-tRNA synthetase beta chain
MKISLEWLREYVDYSDSVERLDEILTEVGFPVEDRAQVGDDWMLDVEITSNRPDCLGHIGLAREVAAATGGAFKLPKVYFSEESKGVEEWTSVTNEAADLCGRYTARVISQVQVGPSPGWMRRRLETIGQRSISNVVDITNYVLMEVGQPLHTFDYDRLGEGRIVVRRAQNGERMETIDHSLVELNNDMLVIADATAPVALAGIMGGLASEVSDTTSTILLESAHFDPLCTRRTSRGLSVASESSFRFERNVDMVMVEWASRRAACLLGKLAGGKVAAGVINSWPGKEKLRQIELRLSRLKLLLGIEIPVERIVEILSRLGLKPQYDGDNTITCTAPAWRSDIRREVDLIEEVMRIHGYGAIPTERKIHIHVTTSDRYQRTCRKVTEALNGCGYYETVNVSFIEDDYWRPFVEEEFEPVRVQDLSRKANNALRPSLLGSLVRVRKRNQDSGNDRCDIYELAATHQPDPQGELPKEKIMLALLSDGDLRELRGVIETVINTLDKKAQLTCQSEKVLWAQDGAGAKLLWGETVIGQAGRAKQEIIKLFDLNQGACLAELDFAALVEREASAVEITPLPRFPGVQRDLSLVLDEEICWADIKELISQQGIEDLQEIIFVDIYRGKGIEAGKKSLTLSLLFRRGDETLTHEQVDGEQEKIIDILRDKFGAILRA